MSRRLIMTIEVIVPDFMKDTEAQAMVTRMEFGLKQFASNKAYYAPNVNAHEARNYASLNLLASVERTDNAPATQTEKEPRT